MSAPSSKVSFLILGSGTSQGVPAIGCDCETCTSKDPRDVRLRPSILIQSKGKNIVVDTSSDFRQQMLTNNIRQLDAILFTHHHFDHIGGFDDVRQFNFIHRREMQCFASKETIHEIQTSFRYAFGNLFQEGGGVPRVVMNEIRESELMIEDIPIRAIEVMHGRLAVLAFRVGSLAYVTDTNDVSGKAIGLLQGLDALIFDALRHEKHPTHYSLQESIEAAKRIGAKQTYFTHIAHDICYARDSVKLPPGMEFAYDGLRIEGTV